MRLGHIDHEDRKVLYVIGGLALALTIGLSITGIWLLLFHEPNPALSGYVVGRRNPPSIGESSGVAWVHGALGDFAGILTLFGGAWFMVRVIHRFSWFSATSLLVLVSSLVTGGVIRFSASVQDGVVDVTTRGYLQFFTGDAQIAITDRDELNQVWMLIWTIAHISSIPFLVATAVFTFRQARRRHAEMKANGPRWFKGLKPNPDPHH